MSNRLVVWSFVVAGAGCVAGDSEPPQDGGNATAVFTAAQAKAAGEALGAGIESTAQRFGPVSAAMAIDASCVTPSGDASDADGDSIPASAKLTFDCSERRLGYTGTLTGTEAVTDTAPTVVAWAFSATVDLQASLTGPFGGSLVVDTDGAIAATQGGALGPFELASTLDVISVITNVRGMQTTVAEDLDLTVAYTPSVQWTPGGPAVVGMLATDGAWNVSVDDKSALATVSTSEPLVLSPACETRITGGRVEATFPTETETATIAVQWSGCGNSAVSYAP